ncbi:site-specific integrase [Nodosilinea sp. LEGE 07088]|uniref:tyrosine-type recombinase/integrase n=1 Tax=Nodosilinea sp. LEGE 07088 TaxID=2777968 RepID=UPI0018822648|nr:site-specific integrase [Nodosilinea sp. LEGE 07088]MBE9137458.1 site-specific integrase [Nodosilinea sp. LEGE 07088]
MFTAADFELGAIELPEARKVDRRGQARNLTPENLRTIFAELPTNKWRAVFAIAYFTGSRISEVLSLDVADVANDRISFRRENTKTKKPRVAMVVDVLRPFLTAYDAPGAGYLFPAHHNGQGGHVSRQAADKVLRDACEFAGLDGVSTHSFRRSFATNLHKQGYSLAKIARLLGHSSASMTARYVE